ICFIEKLGQRDWPISPETGSLLQTFLRRTFVTVAQRTLRDLATVKKLVNHSSGADVTMKHYLRLSVEDLREPMQRVEDAFDRLRMQPHIFGEKI
ncbi:hypothetical protein ACSVIJ_17755, partial [Pseudomonas sp. NCHU5208]